MEVQVKKNKKIISVIPKSCNGVLKYYDFTDRKFYEWEDLEPVRVRAEADSSAESAIRIGVTPCIKTNIVTKGA